MSKRDEFLRKQKILHLATISKDGNPHIIPVWYLYSGKKIYIGTNTKTEKAKNIKLHKKVSFCVDVGIHAPKIFGVMGKGHARLITNKTKVSKMAEKILLRYFKTLNKKSAKEILNDTDCIIEIVPREYSVWQY